MTAYITGVGSCLPGEPIGNDELDTYIGTTPGSKRHKQRMLKATGIEKRHYAIDRAGRTTMLNEELAAHAVREAFRSRGLTPRDVGTLATGTTQGDLPVPGFASMVHGRLGGGPMEVLSPGGVCCSGIAALRAVEAVVTCASRLVCACRHPRVHPCPPARSCCEGISGVGDVPRRGAHSGKGLTVLST